MDFKQKSITATKVYNMTNLHEVSLFDVCKTVSDT